MDHEVPVADTHGLLHSICRAPNASEELERILEVETGIVTLITLMTRNETNRTKLEQLQEGVWLRTTKRNHFARVLQFFQKTRWREFCPRTKHQFRQLGPANGQHPRCGSFGEERGNVKKQKECSSGHACLLHGEARMGFSAGCVGSRCVVYFSPETDTSNEQIGLSCFNGLIFRTTGFRRERDLWPFSFNMDFSLGFHENRGSLQS